MKKCSKCGIEREVSQFYKSKQQKCGLHPHCKSCKREYFKKRAVLERENRHKQDKYKIPDDAKPIKQLNNKYFITKEGDVYSQVRQGGGGKVKCWICPNGYKRFSYTINSITKNYAVHRALAQTFIPNPNEYPIVDHIDRNRTNNNLDNLRWCDYKLNSVNKEIFKGSIFINKRKFKNKTYCYFRVKYGTTNLGSFKTKEEAQKVLDDYIKHNANRYRTEKINKAKEATDGSDTNA